jgi:putative transcriptional regulator
LCHKENTSKVKHHSHDKTQSPSLTTILFVLPMIPDSSSLLGQCLIAMPGLDDPRFERSVIYICIHDADTGAMGLILNKPVTNVTFEELLKQMDISHPEPLPPTPVLYGGPVDPNRGFVLHSLDYQTEETLPVSGTSLGLTTTLEILKERADGRGPRHFLLALGYAGWDPGQLETEILANQWIHASLDDLDLLFQTRWPTKWQDCLKAAGISLDTLSGEAGHA